MPPTDRAARRRAWLAGVAVCLAVALLSFTTIYRNTAAFSAANPTRCHSMSGEHGSVKALFTGDFGPLCAMAHYLAPTPPAAVELPVRPVDQPHPLQLLALAESPDRRPPPVRF